MISINNLITAPSLTILFISAAMLKLILIWSLIGASGSGWAKRFEQQIGYDDTEYFSIAGGLAKYHVMSFPDKARQPEPQIYRTPLYPAFLSAVGSICNWHPLNMLMVQASIFSLLPVLLCLALRQAGCSTGYSWLIVFDPITNLLSITFMTEGLLVLLLIGSFYFLAGAEKPRHRLAALILLGLAILVKPSVQFFYIFLCVYLLTRYRPRQITLVLILVSMLPLVMWMGRNYHEAGLFVISTQKNAAIMAVETIKAKEAAVADSDLLEAICHNWAQDHNGENIYDRIMSNRQEFKGVTGDYIRNHPILFAKYHSIGMVRVLLGTARNHLRATLPGSGEWPPAAWNLYNVGMLAYYSILYATLILTFRFRSLKSELAILSWVFVCYNIALIGVLAYTTGGGLKRAPFIPFLIIILALQMKSILEPAKKVHL